jgi:hypothetical protein
MTDEEYEKRKGGKMRLWQIWIGKYHLGQGSDPPTEPQMIAEVEATTFDLACLKYELRTSLDSIERREAKGEYIDFQSRRWFYDWDKNANSWTGRYFETKEEAQQTF